MMDVVIGTDPRTNELVMIIDSSHNTTVEISDEDMAKLILGHLDVKDFITRVPDDEYPRNKMVDFDREQIDLIAYGDPGDDYEPNPDALVDVGGIETSIPSYPNECVVDLGSYDPPT